MIDPEFHSVARSVRVGRPKIARPVAVGEDAVWTVAGSGSWIVRLDPRTERPVATIPVGNGPSSVVIGEGAVWVGDSADGTVSRIDPRTNKVVATIAVGQSISAIAVGAGGVWVTVPLEDRVKRIDPASNAVAESIRVPGGPTAAAIGAGGLWVTAARAGTVTRVDPDRARVDPHDPRRSQPPGRGDRRRSRLGVAATQPAARVHHADRRGAARAPPGAPLRHGSRGDLGRRAGVRRDVRAAGHPPGQAVSGRRRRWSRTSRASCPPSATTGARTRSGSARASGSHRRPARR